jgi:hypothetical protein
MASKSELMAEAQRLGVRGRTSMTKADLSAAVEARRGGQPTPPRTTPPRTRARPAARTPRPAAVTAPRVDLYTAASRGKVGPLLRGLSPERLAELAKRAGVATEGADTKTLRKALGAKAYDGVASSRALAGYAQGAAPRAAAALSRVKVVPESAAKSLAAGAWSVAKEGVVGFASGGVRGGATAVARAVGTKGKVALGVAAAGFAAYEAHEGYKLDGVKGAGFGVIDGTINVLSAGTLGGEFASRAAGYDYGKARREAEEKAAAEAPVSAPAPDAPTPDPALISVGLFGPSAKAKGEHAQAVADAATKDIKDGLKVTAAGVAVAGAGVLAHKASSTLAASAAAGQSALGTAIKLSAAVPLRVGGKTAAFAGALAAVGGVLHAATRPSVKDVPPPRRSLFGAGPGNSYLNAAAETKAATADTLAAKAPAKPTAPRPEAQTKRPAGRSSYTTKDGRTVEATEGQTKAYQARRISI